METEILNQAFDAIAKGGEAYGFLGALAAMLTCGVGVFKFFAPDYWRKQKKWVKLTWIFSTATGGALIVAVVSQVALPTALFSAMIAGLTAIGIHQSKKAMVEGGEDFVMKRQLAALKQMQEISRNAPDLAPEIKTKDDVLRSQRDWLKEHSRQFPKSNKR